MIRLLKAEYADAAIRPLPAGRAAAAPLDVALDDPTAQLFARIAELEAGLAMAATELPGELERAREEGRQEGLKERDQASAERLALLEKALASAIQRWSDRLSGTNALAIDVARLVLERMVAAPEWNAELVRGAIARRLSELSAGAAVRVRVSGEDFGGDELPPAGANNSICIDPELRSGECLVDLVMGQIDLGIAAQWRQAARLLDELAGDEC